MFRGLKALLAGVLAGTALGVLFAPKKGRETRKKLTDEIDEGGIGWDTIKETFSTMGRDFGDTCKDCYEELKKDKKFQEAEKNIKRQAKIAKKHAKEWIKENLDKKTIKKAKKTYKKAKSTAKKAYGNAKKTATKVAKKRNK